MDYSKNLDNPSPNAHDYEQLVSIYGGHVDSGAIPKTKKNRNARTIANANAQAQENWGKKVHESKNGKSAVFHRSLGGGLQVSRTSPGPGSAADPCLRREAFA